MDVGEKIKIALEARGMSQKELSEKAHATEASISRYINGERYPKWQIAKRIADALDVSLDWLADRKTESSSEIPNNCEHITEDGVTCAKYPACDDCLDNPLNKVKGSERLLKGKDEPTISKMEQVDKDINVRSKEAPYIDIETGILHWCGWKYRRIYEDEPQTDCLTCRYNSDEWDSPKCDGCSKVHSNYEPQTDCPWK